MQNGTLRVKIYIERRKYATEIEAWKSKKADLKCLIKNLKADLQRLGAEGIDGLEEIQAHMDGLSVSVNPWPSIRSEAAGRGSQVLAG